MKKSTLHLVLCWILLLSAFELQSQSLPITAYGIWDRGEGITDYSNPKADFVNGIELLVDWADIQKIDSVKFDFSAFQSTLDVAAINHKMVKLSINVGPNSPLWLYSNGGVPLAAPVISDKPEKHDEKFANYPFYSDKNYKRLYFKLIEAFALFLRGQDQAKFDCIAFVQVKTGATGDEEPYKGVPPVNYTITKNEWENFRLEAFNKYKQCFNDVADRKIVLTFNNVDPLKQPDAYNYVMTKMDTELGFGIKGGAYNRGHHLSDEQSYKKQWTPYLINPKGIKLFSASEMDDSWTMGFFAKNYEIGFYWSALGGTNTGLSTMNVSAAAIKFAMSNPGIRDIFKMYNKYAQQVYPQTAIAAYSVFHEGLDAADTKKFPESKYGKASRTNTDRYLKICADPQYWNRGARISDTAAVILGQVDQRYYQKDYNDAGWDIEAGNFERFFTQINPESTSIGLFRLRAPLTTNSSKYDRFARSFENSSRKNTMYFKFDPEVFSQSLPQSLKFKIVWLDNKVGSKWSFTYNSVLGTKEAIQVVGVGGNTWKEVTFTINDAKVDKRGVYGSDFTLKNTDSIDDIFNGIEIDINRMSAPSAVENTMINSKDFISYFKHDEFCANIESTESSKANIQLFDNAGNLKMSDDILLQSGNNFYTKAIILPTGIYIAVLKSGNKTLTQKLVK